MLTKRTNILFDELLWKKLSSFAKKRKSSVGDVVRNAVLHYIEEEAKYTSRSETIDIIQDIRPRIKSKLNYKEMVEDGRKY